VFLCFPQLAWVHSFLFLQRDNLVVFIAKLFSAEKKAAMPNALAQYQPMENKALSW